MLFLSRLCSGSENPLKISFLCFQYSAIDLLFFTSETKKCNAVRSVRQMPSGHKTLKRRLEKLIRIHLKLVHLEAERV